MIININVVRGNRLRNKILDIGLMSSKYSSMIRRGTSLLELLSKPIKQSKETKTAK